MEFIKIIRNSIFIFLFFGISFAYAQKIIYTTVPFQNISLNPTDAIVATFSFGQQSQLFCFDNTLQTEGVINWPYHSQPQSSSLPIFLTLNPQFQGSLTDPNGTLTVYNNTGITLQENCIYSM